MITNILAASFDLIWKVENQPYVDILRFNINNTPQKLNSLVDISAYIPVKSNVPCIYAGGTALGQLDDDTTRTDLTLFIRSSDVSDLRVSLKWIFKYEKRLYKLLPKDPNVIYNLIEFNLLRAD